MNNATKNIFESDSTHNPNTKEMQTNNKVEIGPSTNLMTAENIRINGDQIKEIKTDELLISVPTSSINNLGTFFGLPNSIKTLIQEIKGIDDLYGKQNPNY